MSELRITNISNSNNTSGPVISGIASITSTGYVQFPKGNDLSRVGISSGALRYNTDAKLYEFYTGTEWKYIIPSQESSSALGVFSGGYQALYGYSVNRIVDTVDYITISSRGNAKNFGFLARGGCRFGGTDGSSTTRGLIGGIERNPLTESNILEYIIFSTKGSSSDFGSLLSSVQQACGVSNKVRAVYGSFRLQTNSYNSALEYVTIATTGNAISFGNSVVNPTSTNWRGSAAFASSIRGYWTGGRTATNPDTFVNTIDYITFSTTGNSINYGATNPKPDMLKGCSNANIGVFGGAYTYLLSMILSTTGTVEQFGSIYKHYHPLGTASSSIRGTFAGGMNYQGVNGIETDASLNIINYITFSTKGNALNFGDLTRPTADGTACSNNHGGTL